MPSHMDRQVRHLKATRKRRSRMKRLLAVLCVIVIGITTYAMTFPAITQNNDLVCKMQEHEHTSVCYQNKQVLICDQNESEEHAHQEACYTHEPRLVCPLTEHKHGDACLEYETPTDFCETPSDSATDTPSDTQEDSELVQNDLPSPQDTEGNISVIADDVYWQRVSAITDTSANYLIVPGNTSVALAMTKSGNATSADATSLTINEVVSAPGYYSISGVTDGSKWKFTASGGNYQITNVAYSSYGLRLSNRTYINSTKDNITVAYTASSDTFTLKGGSYYLIYRNSAFSRSTSYSTNRPMVLYKEVDSLPDDGGSGGDSGNGGSQGGSGSMVEKPTYPEYVNPSPLQSGNTALNNINGTYDSDPGSSSLESLFQGIPEDDGRIEADKSVVYGNDDYDAFATYDPNTFGITLSALGQKYSLTQEFGIAMPLDVVFVLDTSGSMISGKTTDGKTCAAAMIQALNQTMAEIYKSNPNNRVGVVCFSGQGHTLLKLGRYTAPNNKFFPENAYTSNTATLTANSQIANLDGGTVERGSFNLWYGTYTQSGIALGAKQLLDADPVFNGTISYDEDGTNRTLNYSVRRHPVMILLSDGDPTYSTSEYDNVLNASKIYGDGQASNTTNNQGVNGYYTILSAKYYKDQVTAHYNANTSFYSVGLGMSETATNDSSGQSVTGDHYKRAILDPSADNISALSATYSNDTNRSTTSQQLYKLLNNTYTGTTITLSKDTTNYNKYGLPHATDSTIPVVKNPYINSAYNYADAAYFNQKLTAQQLAEQFIEGIKKAENIPVYGLVLKANTTIRFTDNIGKGMEMKGQPVIRCADVNYQPVSADTVGNTTTYSYSGLSVAKDGSGEVINLSNIKVNVTTQNGTQTVVWDIPDNGLPCYTPRISSSGEILFYYESLPIRCIYQVGPNAQTQQEVAKIAATGGQITLYTNMWEDGTGANTTIYPTDGNPYYLNGQHRNEHRSKIANQTETVSYTTTAISNHAGVGQWLGNNGRLQFSVTELSIPLKKAWDSSVLPEQTYPVTAYLYLVKDEDMTVVADSVISATLNSENGWQTALTVSTPPQGYHYYLAEPSKEGYYAAYRQGETVLLTHTVTLDGQAVTAARIDTLTAEVSLTIENFHYAVLPPTGGSGALIFTLFGGFLMVLSATWWLVTRSSWCSKRYSKNVKAREVKKS